MNFKTEDLPAITVSLLINLISRQRAFQLLLIEILNNNDSIKCDEAIRLLEKYSDHEKEVLFAALYGNYGSDPISDLPDGITPP